MCITYFSTVSEDGSQGQNYSAMVLILPHLQKPPEISVDLEPNDITNNESLSIKWEEDSTNAVELATFLSITDHPENLEIMNQCYMKGKPKKRCALLNIYFLFPFQITPN